MSDVQKAIGRIRDHVTDIDEEGMTDDFAQFLEDLRVLLGEYDRMCAEHDKS